LRDERVEGKLTITAEARMAFCAVAPGVQRPFNRSACPGAQNRE
jgi:hypothetical protein